MRLITPTPGMRDKRWMISSLTPSEKNCMSLSLDRFSKARTAMVGDWRLGPAGASCLSSGRASGAKVSGMALVAAVRAGMLTILVRRIA